ncbi:MmyB family transcriptional regulator, partial [Nocardia fluminea]|uniref:MmyB family transcriptional regulator n=1 Tax=Nocardia fluminea TaxID=134984 RepID=UPI0033E28C79
GRNSRWFRHDSDSLTGQARKQRALPQSLTRDSTTTPTAETLVVDWKAAAAYLVASLRAAFGIHRHNPQAQELFQKLCGSATFTELWNTELEVAYGYPTDEPLRLRDPDTGNLYSVRIHLGARVRTHLDTPELRFFIGYRDPRDSPTQL